MDNAPIFFLHFPRTAGTTIDDVFFNNLPQEQILRIYARQEYDKCRFMAAESLENIRYITGHLLLSSLDPPQFYGRPVRPFTILRDPLKRLYSEYVFLKTWKHQHLYDYLNSNGISFAEYIQSTAKLLRYRGKNFMTRCISGIALDEKNLEEGLAKAKYNLEHNFMFFGIQDRFMESMLLLSRKAGLKNIIHQRRNALNYDAGKIAMPNAEDWEIVREHNQADIELYDHACELFDRRIREEGPRFQADLKNYKFINSKYQKIAGLIQESAGGEENTGIELPKESSW